MKNIFQTLWKSESSIENIDSKLVSIIKLVRKNHLQQEKRTEIVVRIGNTQIQRHELPTEEQRIFED